MKKEIRIFLLVSILIIILTNLFLITAAPTSSTTLSIPITKQIFNFFNNFTSGTQGFIISLLPLVILIGISYLLIRKGNRTLIAVEWLLWLIYAIYMLAKVFAFSNIYFNWNILPVNYSIYLINPPAELNAEAYKWFIWSIIINTVVALLFSFKNNWLVSMFLRFKNKPAPVDYQI